MGLIFKARGSASFGIFLIRFTIGMIFLIAGMKKIMDVESFINYVKSLHILPANLAFIFGFILPFAEILFGILFIIGFLTPITSIVLSIMNLSFIITYTVLHSEVVPYSISPMAYNIVMLACTIMVLFSGAGVVSFDVLLDKKKEKRAINVTPVMNTQPPVGNIPQTQTEVRDAEFTDTNEKI